MSNNNQPFRLINYQAQGSQVEDVHVGLEIGERIFSLDALAEHYPLARKLSELSHASVLQPGTQGLLIAWEQSFDDLCVLANALQSESKGTSFTLNDVHVLAPVLRPTKLLCTAANYERHLREVANWKEAGVKPGEFKGIDKSTTKPYVFVKLPYCIRGPFDPVIRPHFYDRLDWEGELGIVIGKRGKSIPVERAMDHVAGFLIFNDYSLREVNLRQDWPGMRSDWFLGKNFDTAAVLGPYIVPKQFMPNYLELQMRLTVNGELKQQASTGEMVFKPDELIAFASGNTTLEPGDVIATGSPPGAGFADGKFLNVGDVVEAEIEGLGRQRNVIIDE